MEVTWSRGGGRLHIGGGGGYLWLCPGRRPNSRRRPKPKPDDGGCNVSSNDPGGLISHNDTNQPSLVKNNSLCAVVESLARCHLRFFGVGSADLSLGYHSWFHISTL